MRTTPLLCALLLLAGPACAQSDLLACRVIVTGSDLRSRPEGLARCVRAVVVKVTGKPGLAEDPRTAAITAHADELVDDFVYLDRMSDLPRHDEQGSRDRPYDLIAHVNAAQLTAALQAAGLRPWLERPALTVSIAIRTRDGAAFAMTPDGDDSERHRQSLLAAAEQFGMRVVLPRSARANRLLLRGAVAWSEGDFGWNAEWQLVRDGDPVGAWTVRGVSFDDAYRAGVGGAAERLAP